MRKFLGVFLVLALILSFSAVSFAEYKGTVTFEVNLKDAEKAEKAELWLPYPLSDANQTVTFVDIKSNGAKVGVESDPKGGAVYLHATWTKPAETPNLTMSFRIDSHYSKNENIKETKDAFPPEVLKYLEATPSLPIDKGFCAEASMEFINKP
ncbi:MAG: hypothetical protein II917_11190, partial [Synergistaceae bacterium]|nr:hypothetical protein [Synergistaceae bacterium]